MTMTVTRSSLEEMLDSLRKRDDAIENSRDLPPELPSRPTSRARRPSSRRPLPGDFKVDAEGVLESNHEEGSENLGNGIKRKESEVVRKMNSFGSKKMRACETPYEECLETCEETDWNENIRYFIKKKLRVWSQTSTGLWESGFINSCTGNTATITLSSGKTVEASAEDLLPANPELLEGVDDLISLSYLNEPSVLHTLKWRYSRDLIYSKAGSVVISINPFKEVPIYGDQMVNSYRKRIVADPHIYALSDAAYDDMMRESKNQSLIISGESGAGKTETAKHAMRYLASLGGGADVEYKISQTNQILEAFGNAKTSRNNNSSRFGKLTEIHFTSLGRICGASIQTFLLEKSRVAQVTNGERSYHVFYELCAGAPSSLKEKLHLRSAHEYYYLSQSECFHIPSVDDAGNFCRLLEAFDALGVSKEEQEQAMKILAAILWIGNISFKANSNDHYVAVLENEAVEKASELMSCEYKELMTCLSAHKIKAGNDNIFKNLNLAQAMDRRDALAKFIYSSLFDWLVEIINNKLQWEEEKSVQSISILDIYGFESNKINSFEQFCINYANERLQQHFIRHLFKLQQQEYEEEGVDWRKIDFSDNQDCLDLFEKKPFGLLSILDEESNFPKATDLTFANKLKQHLTCNPCFKGDRGRSFHVQHYAGKVSYDTNGFLEKNRDPLHAEFLHLLSSSSSHLLGSFASRQADEPSCARLSVAAKFKGQLFKLMSQLESTSPQFIRCIKPNSALRSGALDDELVLQQLRCCGILEVVRISRCGYPTRMTHLEFSRRYGDLLVEFDDQRDPLTLSVSLFKRFAVPHEMYQIGYTKVFLRSGVIAMLEDRRKQFFGGIIGLQKCFRGYQARRRFDDLRKRAILLQSCIRGGIDRARYWSVVKSRIPKEPEVPREHIVAAIRLQSGIRRWLAQNKLKKEVPTPGKPRKLLMKKIAEVKIAPEEQFDTWNDMNRKLANAEATIHQKEEENAVLRQQVQDYERRWREYEAKMESMEETWQAQMASLQASLADAQRARASEAEAASVPETPRKIADFMPAIRREREQANGHVVTIRHLEREFEEQRRCFDDEASALGESGGRQAVGGDDVELRKLKQRFDTWKKDYKARLKEMKGKVCGRSYKRWWGK